jgi:hypothetical protein
LDGKGQPILWTEWPTGAVMGDWFTLAFNLPNTIVASAISQNWGIFFKKKTLL